MRDAITTSLLRHHYCITSNTVEKGTLIQIFFLRAAVVFDHVKLTHAWLQRERREAAGPHGLSPSLAQLA